MRMMIWILALCLAGCGSSGSGGSVATTNQVQVTGDVVAGALDGMLSVDNRQGGILQTTITGGHFRISLPVSWLAMPLRFLAEGSYRDEVSGLRVTVAMPAPLSLDVAANALTSQGTKVAISIDTTILAEMTDLGLTRAQAESIFSSVFGYLPRFGVTLFDPYATDAAMATSLMQQDPYAGAASFRLGMFSQWAWDLGMRAPGDLAVLARLLARDLADGMLDGLDAAGSPIVSPSGIDLRQLHGDAPLANRLAMAVAGFAHSPVNRSALPAPLSTLPAMPGDAPGSTRMLTLGDGTWLQVQLDASYATPFPSPFLAGRSRHILRIRNALTGLPVSTAAATPSIGVPQVSAWMHAMVRSPFPAAVSSVDVTRAAQGEYGVDVFYPSASLDANGLPVGQWELRVAIPDLTAARQPREVRFYPWVVDGGLGDVLQLSLTNAADVWMDAYGMLAPREYRLSLQDIWPLPTGGYGVKVFLSTQDASRNVSTNVVDVLAPAVLVGLVLHDTRYNPIPVVNVSLGVWDQGVCRPMSPLASEPGSYRLDGVFGLATGVRNSLSFCLSVNGLAMKDAAGSDPVLRFRL